ncbi:phosphatase PAP2 family protein [Kitasatospora sp. NBC_01287]|uniref:phosphatase PAP2 family protein n=1 Tax=Kitasatospora sp. NBC_01287 TaxID=2903573 RepID=UPI0022527886|nr:phosphatase PAP2 family protein [Kitasatospora sp. NBC_01287]MCX4747408.1 phosphatase PAP2 family protein [Kitasatospora sp. NBC_01287]
MSTLSADTTNPDLELLYTVNGWAKGSPAWLDTLVSWIGEYGILLGLVALCAAAWLRARRRPNAPVAVAGVLWAPLAMALAELANLPISAIVGRPRPFVNHPGLDVLVAGKAGTYSFVSDHATMSMAVAVALFLVDRRLGALAGSLAALQGFCRIFMGVHYPTDVLGGYALATAVVLLLAPLAMSVLVPLCHALARTTAAPLITAGPAGTPRGGRRRRGGTGGGRSLPEPEHAAPADSDLAA